MPKLRVLLWNLVCTAFYLKKSLKNDYIDEIDRGERSYFSCEFNHIPNMVFVNICVVLRASIDRDV